MFLIRKKRRKRKRKFLTSDEVHELQTYIERSIAMVLSYPQKHQLFFWASSTLFLMSDITWAGSGAPNTELPATMQFAPAEAASAMVEGPKPPSTWKPNRKKYIHVHVPLSSIPKKTYDHSKPHKLKLVYAGFGVSGREKDHFFVYFFIS